MSIWDKIHSYRVTNAVESTSVTEMTRRENPALHAVAPMDYGYKENIRREPESAGQRSLYARNTTADELPFPMTDGVMLSNGPSDPADNIEVIETSRRLLNMGKPLFGICLGHPTAGLANGFKTGKKSSNAATAAQTSRCKILRPAASTSPARTMATVVSSTIDPEVADEYFNNVKRQNVRGRAL